jgi:hypothetical protein
LMSTTHTSALAKLTTKWCWAFSEQLILANSNHASEEHLPLQHERLNLNYTIWATCWIVSLSKFHLSLSLGPFVTGSWLKYCNYNMRVRSQLVVIDMMSSLGSLVVSVQSQGIWRPVIRYGWTKQSANSR